MEMIFENLHLGAGSRCLHCNEHRKLGQYWSQKLPLTRTVEVGIKNKTEKHHHHHHTQKKKEGIEMIVLRISERKKKLSCLGYNSSVCKVTPEHLGHHHRENGVSSTRREEWLAVGEQSRCWSGNCKWDFLRHLECETFSKHGGWCWGKDWTLFRLSHSVWCIIISA